LVIDLGVKNGKNLLYLHRFIKKDGGKWPDDVLATGSLQRMQWCQLQPKQLGRDEAIQISLSPTLLIFCRSDTL
jgi:hypothetical protein